MALTQRKSWTTTLILLAATAILPLSAGCARRAADGDNVKVTTEPAGAENATPPERTAEAIVFLSNPDAAIKRAASENKVVMLDVYTDWCTWCKKLDEEVYARPAVARAVGKGFVPLKVNPEETAAAREFVDRYTVRGYPTILFLNGKGEEVHRVVGYVDEDQFLKELHAAREKSGQA